MRWEAALHHGDTLEVMAGFADRSVDMILCDLPYGTTACKWDVVIPFDKLGIERDDKYFAIADERVTQAVWGSSL